MIYIVDFQSFWDSTNLLSSCRSCQLHFRSCIYLLNIYIYLLYIIYIYIFTIDIYYVYIYIYVYIYGQNKHAAPRLSENSGFSNLVNVYPENSPRPRKGKFIFQPLQFSGVNSRAVSFRGKVHLCISKPFQPKTKRWKNQLRGGWPSLPQPRTHGGLPGLWSWGIWIR